MKNSLQITDFFKPQNFQTSKSDLAFEGIKYERLFSDYFSGLFNLYKSKIPLELPNDKIIRNSKWEPLLKAGHHSFITTLVKFLPVMEGKTEMEKLMECFNIIKHHGMGVFELGLAPKNTFMKICVTGALEDSAFELSAEKIENPVCAFTAGIVLACFNLYMSSFQVKNLDSDSLNEIYQNSPDIIQVKYGSVDLEESEFTIQARS